MFKRLFYVIISVLLFGFIGCEERGTIEKVDINNDKWEIERLYVSSTSFIYVATPKENKGITNVIQEKTNGKSTYYETSVIDKRSNNTPQKESKYVIESDQDSIIILKRVN